MAPQNTGIWRLLHRTRILSYRRLSGPEVALSVVQGGGRKGTLSSFIEEAVRAHLLERAAAQAKTAATGMSEAEMSDLIDEAVQWARER